MKRLTVILISIVMLLASACSKEPNRYQAQFMSLFDTLTTIIGYSDSKEEFTHLSERMKDMLEEYHVLYDIYNDYEGINNIKTINDNAGKSPVKVDKRIIDLLEFATEQYDASGGAVNIAFGSVLSIWHEYRMAGVESPLVAQLPPMELLESAALHTNIEDIIIDKEASTVFLKDPLMRLDVGAVAKGYATEQTARHFENEGIAGFLLSVGGNIRAIGGKLNGRNVIPWSIGIGNPDKTSPRTELMNVQIYDSSLVSSGVYERYYTVDGTRYHHIINSDTLMPVRSFEVVSIICPDSGMADALSTAIFNMSLEDGMAYIKSLPDTEALWVFGDGSMEYSEGFLEYAEK